MKSCPHCGKKTTNQICEYCKMDTSLYSSLSPLIRKLKLSVRIKNKEDILKYANLILEQDRFYFYAIYHKTFINYLDGKEEELYKVISEKVKSDEIDEIINHLVLNNVKEDKVKEFIRLNGKGTIDLNKEINLDTINLLFSETKLRFNNKADERIKNGKTLIKVGTIIWVIISLILLLFNSELRYIYTMIFLILPSYLVSKGLMFILFKKNISIFLIIILLVVVLSILSFVSVIDIQKGVVYHIKQVLTFPYEFIRYYLRRVIINI